MHAWNAVEIPRSLERHERRLALKNMSKSFRRKSLQQLSKNELVEHVIKLSDLLEREVV